MTGFQNPFSAVGIGQDFTTTHDADMFRAVFQARGAGIVPNGFLTGTGFDALYGHSLKKKLAPSL